MKKRFTYNKGEEYFQIYCFSERLVYILREIEKLTYFDHPGLVKYQNAWKEEPPKCEVILYKKII